MSEASKQVATRRATQITPMELLRTSVDRGDDLARIEKLMELERAWKADRAKEAFNEALAEFKKIPVVVVKDKENKQYSVTGVGGKKAMYVSLANLVNTVNVEMAPFGLSASWEVDQTAGVRVTCVLTHTLGHSKSVGLTGPLDTSGSKNALQQIKSTITYLQGATFQAVTGVVAQDPDGDDDGNGSSGDRIDETQVANLQALIEEVGADKAAFLKYIKAEKLEDIPTRAYSTCVKALEGKRRKPK